MSRSRGRVLALAVVVLAVATGVALSLVLRDRGADSANGSTTIGSLDELTGRWVLLEASHAPSPAPGPLELQVDGDRLLVRPGCNTGSGTAKVEDSRLVIPDGLAVTEMACLDGGLMEQESWVLDMLGDRPRLERSGPYLYLHWGEGERYWLALEQVTPSP